MESSPPAATTTSRSSPAPAGETPAQEKARLRRERRTAKIQAGGASRLQAITSLNGGRAASIDNPPSPAAPQTSTSPAAPAAAARTTSAPAQHPDPAEIDISTHHYTPAATAASRQPSPFAFNGAGTPPFLPGLADNNDTQDPMMAMLQKMMGAGNMPGAGPGGPNQQGAGASSPGLAQLMQAMNQGDPLPPAGQSSAYIWRIIHAVFSLALSVYMILQTPFTGSRLTRTSAAVEETDWTLSENPAEAFKHFFYLFATFQVVLQTTRYFIEKGQPQGSGMLSTIAQMLPEPWAGRLRVAGRYSVIWSTVVGDAMVVVFVLGATSWWKGAVA